MLKIQRVFAYEFYLLVYSLLMTTFSKDSFKVQLRFL